MSYKLDFFDSFVCSGSACQNTCCSGWDIALDKETYDFYEASHGAFSKYVKKNIGQTDGNYRFFLKNSSAFRNMIPSARSFDIPFSRKYS